MHVVQLCVTLHCSPSLLFVCVLNDLVFRATTLHFTTHSFVCVKEKECVFFSVFFHGGLEKAGTAAYARLPDAPLRVTGLRGVTYGSKVGSIQQGVSTFLCG